MKKQVVSMRRAPEADRFLRLLWPDFPVNGKLLLWTLPEKQSYWYDDLAQAAVDACKFNSDSDVYLGVGLAPDGYISSLADGGIDKRCPSSKIIAIPGFALDIDIDGPGRKKKGLFPTREEAKAFIDEHLPIKPTLEVFSGGGYQLWFLFKEPWVFEGDQERAEAEQLSQGWNHAVQKIAKKIGYSVDSVFDLARVLRIPGTNNLKNDLVKQVTLDVSDGPRYNPGDFDRWKEAIAPVGSITVGGLRLDGDAHPPFDKFQALQEIDRKFTQTWNHKRRDLGDDSMSSYDMSLAMQMAAAGWTAQEIVDTLIAHRRKYGADLKLRESYYKVTAEKALNAQRSNQTAKDVSLIVEKARIDKEDVEIKDDEREKILTLIENTTGLALEKVIQHGEDSVQFSIELKDGRNIHIGPVAKLTSFENWINIAMVHGNRIPHRPKAAVWHDALTCIKTIVEIRASDDIRTEEVVYSWLRGYAQEAVNMTKADGVELAGYIATDKPFIKNGILFIRLGGFAHYLREVKREKKEGSELTYLFRLCGLVSEKVQARNGSRTVGRHYWRLDMESLQGYSDSNEPNSSNVS